MEAEWASCEAIFPAFDILPILGYTYRERGEREQWGCWGVIPEQPLFVTEIQA